MLVNGNQPILIRDFDLKNYNYQIIFTNEQDLVEYMSSRCFPDQMDVAFIECEEYKNTFRDIKEICGFRKNLQEEIKKIKELEFKQMMRVTNELINRAEESDLRASNV